ncbi:hypothetical protein SKAU_G00022890 [Synaphobranchus kaupii]|uniref:PiggyBac transposable element-derived protein domain-containing protein n=1 Tax=Synaphobranchus kaupii TaxID=118154 RepID=A0A9Q1GC52_SYNKA|nr:hypothetical protein SKAU_G00022890 [Synaphobranchus kaupii]
MSIIWNTPSVFYGKAKKKRAELVLPVDDSENEFVSSEDKNDIDRTLDDSSEGESDSSEDGNSHGVSDSSELETETGQEETEAIPARVEKAKNFKWQMRRSILATPKWKGSLPPSIGAYEPVDYFRSPLRRETIENMVDQSNLYAIQSDSTKPLNQDNLVLIIGASGNIVLQLASIIPVNQSHKIFYDNWFTSVDLQVVLEKAKIHSVGTVRQNRLAGCTIMPEKIMKKKARGTYEEKQTTHQGVTLKAVKWFDNRPVTLLSTFTGANPITQVQVQLSLLDFKINIASCLTMEKKSTSSKRKGRPSQSVGSAVAEKRRRGPASPMPPEPVRQDNIDHWPMMMAINGRCKYPGCKGIVRTMCTKCGIYLCITMERNCFLEFHKS